MNLKKLDIKKILIISMALLILLTTIFLIIKISNKNKLTAADNGKPIVGDNLDVESIENKTREVIDSVNYLNKVFLSEDYDKSTEYKNQDGLTCRKYIGRMPDIFINIAETIYEKPFSDNGYFDKKTSEDREELYVCKPNCTLTDILTDDVKIVKDSKEDTKTISINSKTYSLKKINNTWKLPNPIIKCSD